MQHSQASEPEATRARQDMSAARDFPRARCRFKYAVCATPQSGGGLLCTGLASTGSAGRPAEFFSLPYLEAYQARSGAMGAVQISGYWRFLIAHRTSPNGVFGMRLHVHQLANIGLAGTQEDFLARFDRLILVRRRNKLAQAVSAWKASSSKPSRAAADGSLQETTSDPYSYRGIAECLRIIAKQEANWLNLLAGFADRTFSITHEELSTNYLQSVQSALEALGLGDAGRHLDPRVPAQRDDANRQWEERFMQDLCGNGVNPSESIPE
jgi:LPS sulfotransferase NodH